MQNTKKRQFGFTLLELLIVVAVIAILSAAVVFVLNPVEILKKARDSQRISDLSVLKNSISTYLTTAANPDLGAGCLGKNIVAAKIYYSNPQAVSPACNADINEGGDVVSGSVFAASACVNPASLEIAAMVDGTGWIPVNFARVAGGSPISNLPVDPTNTAVDASAPNSKDLVYRYVCQESATSPAPSNVFEIDAVLESQFYGPGGDDDRSVKDGGDNEKYYETGSSVRLLGGGENF